jgi:hypothetical protein
VLTGGDYSGRGSPQPAAPVRPSPSFQAANRGVPYLHVASQSCAGGRPGHHRRGGRHGDQPTAGCPDACRPNRHDNDVAGGDQGHAACDSDSSQRFLITGAFLPARLRLSGCHA